MKSSLSFMRLSWPPKVNEQWGFFSVYIISFETSKVIFLGGRGVIYADDTVMEAYYGGDLNIQPSACTLANNIILYNIAVVKGKFDHIKIVTDRIVV